VPLNHPVGKAFNNFNVRKPHILKDSKKVILNHGAADTFPDQLMVSPDGRWAVSPDFRRINDMRPGYGYAGLPDPFADTMAPKDSGIFKIDLVAGTQELIVSLADVANTVSEQYAREVAQIGSEEDVWDIVARRGDDFCGILNGTTNYMLSEMEKGMDYDAALEKAQKLGYAEADPTGDVEGIDAAGKVIARERRAAR